jgi:hypothetical protein
MIIITINIIIHIVLFIWTFTFVCGEGKGYSIRLLWVVTLTAVPLTPILPQILGLLSSRVLTIAVFLRSIEKGLLYKRDFKSLKFVNKTNSYF